MIKSHMIKHSTEEEFLYIWAVVTFYTPTHFKIEYLKVKELGVSPSQSYTIIDGRRNMKYFIDDEDEGSINKLIYPQFREDDKVQY